MTRAAERRQHLAIERTRLRLKDERLQIEAERRAIRRERAEAIVYLRLLCERYGDNRWAEDDSLLTILEEHLAIPLEAHLAELLRQLGELQQAARRVERRPAARAVPPVVIPARAPAPVAPAPPAEPAVPCAVTTLAVRADDGRPGSQARCRCGWQTAACPSEIEATLAGRGHLRASVSTPDPAASDRGIPQSPQRRRIHA